MDFQNVMMSVNTKKNSFKLRHLDLLNVELMREPGIDVILRKKKEERSISLFFLCGL